jgi:hypothetical protein
MAIARREPARTVPIPASHHHLGAEGNGDYDSR